MAVMLVGLLVSLVLVLSVAVIVSLRKCMQALDHMEELGNQVEECLDVLDSCYESVCRSLEIPVLSDEPVVKQLVIDMKRSRDAVLLVANKLVTLDNDEGFEEDE